MSIRVDTVSLISGAIVCGNRGLGVVGSLIPASGDHGPGYAYNDLSLPADNDKEICGRITTWPTGGTLTAYEDTSFEYAGTTDTFQYQLYVDGVAAGSPATVTLQVGAATAQFAVTAEYAAFSGGAAVSSTPAEAAIIAVSDDAVFFGGSFVGPVASISTSTDDATFAGSASVNSTAAMSAISDDATWGGSSLSGAVASISAVCADAVFLGGAGVGTLASIVTNADDAIFVGGAFVSPRATIVSVADDATFSGAGAGYLASGGSYPTAESIAAAVIAALNATTIPVDVHKVLTATVPGRWPTAPETSDAVWNKVLP